MAAISRIMAYGALAAALARCGPAFVWEGVWTGERNTAVRPGTDPALAATIRKVKLTLKPNGDFELTEMGMPTSGRWRISRGTAALETLAVMGQPMPHDRKPPDISLKRNPNGTITLTDPGLAADPSVVLKRDAQP